MNFSVENFGAGFKTVDLALYAGVLVVVYLLFQDKITEWLNKAKDVIKAKKNITDFLPEDPVVEPDDIFFALIQSWKQTRDLAEEYGAEKAVEIADQMFPYLVPKEEAKNNEE